MRDSWNKIKNWFKKDKKKSIIQLALILLVFLVFIPNPTDNQPKTMEETAESYGKQTVTYMEFQKMLNQEEVKRVRINLKAPTFDFIDTKKKVYSTQNPKVENFKETLLKANVEVDEIDADSRNRFISIILAVIPILFIGYLIFSFSKRMSPVSTKSKENTNIPNTVFEHIAGNEESKEEMKFLVDFLKNPDKYKKMGAKLPKGVILYGEPGTGKTLTAKAIAGEAKVPFFSMSGSEFTEMFVGVGAKRVRDLFEDARKKAPAIIFIDEIDSLGVNRNEVSNSEDRKTLTAILNEMDGFKENSGVIVIGATNRLDDLDPAFIRPGRFDKHIAVALPDLKGRLEILKLHAKNKPLAKEVDLNDLAKVTIGMSGAYLEVILNEATILATTKNRSVVTNEDLDDALYKILVKGHKKKRNKEEQEKEVEIVAWHEAGHALVAKLLGTSDVAKVTITPSTTGIGGFALVTPKKIALKSKEVFRNEIKCLYAGRIAEHLLLKDDNKITMGASQDIKEATQIIRDMISQFGMSDQYGMLNPSVLSNRQTFNLADSPIFMEEALKLSKELYEETVQLLTKHQHVLRAIAERLMEKETIVEAELEDVIKNSC